MDHWLWEAKPFSPGQAWLDLLMMAAHSTGTRQWKGSFLVQHRGEVFTSMVALADRWGWDRKKVARFLRALEEDGMVTRDDLPKGTLVTIENYEKFQGRRPEDGTAEGTAEGQQTPQQKDTIKEGKRKIKKEKETRAREGSVDEPSAALEEVKGETMPDWFREQVENTFGRM